MQKMLMMDEAIKAPPFDCGQRLIPTLIDSIADSDPKRLFVSVARSKDLSDGFRDVTYQGFSRAVDRCSRWMERQLGRSQNFKTITYMGPFDLRYPIILLAAVKTGHKVSQSQLLELCEG